MLLIYSAFLKTNRLILPICFQENIDNQQVGCPGKIFTTGLQREIRSAGLQEFAVAHGEGAVAEGGEGRVVCDDDDCLAEGVAEVEE